jgi:uncharacterized protein
MKLRLFILILTALFGVASVNAQNAGEVRRRMEQRLSQVDALKAKGVIGENNRGLLEVRGQADASASAVVAEENKDREFVYATIAKETGATPDAVGKARARRIAQNSNPGVWIQDDAGNWAQKAR